MPIVDFKLTQNSNGIFDFTIKNGNFEKHSGFDTALSVSLFTDARASQSQVLIPQNRRGFLGNIVNPVKGRQLGSLIWLVEQRRLNQNTLNDIVSFAENALKWMVDDGLAVNIQVVGDIIPNSGIELKIDITVINGITETRYLKLWELTGGN